MSRQIGEIMNGGDKFCKEFNFCNLMRRSALPVEGRKHLQLLEQIPHEHRKPLICSVAARRFENGSVFVEAVIDDLQRFHSCEECGDFELRNDNSSFDFELAFSYQRRASETHLTAPHNSAGRRAFPHVLRIDFDLMLALVARAQDVVVVADDNIVITENEFLDGFYEEWRAGRADEDNPGCARRFGDDACAVILRKKVREQNGRAVDNDFIHEELLHISQNAAKPYGVMPNIKEPRAKL